MSSLDIRYVAKLARIALSDAEIEEYGRQLQDLLGHVAAISALPTEEIPATAQVIAARNVVRDDLSSTSLDRETVLRSAPEAERGFFRVPRILAEEP